MATSTKRKKFFHFLSGYFLDSLGRLDPFFRKCLLSDRSNVARIFGVRNLRDFCCTLQWNRNPTRPALNRSNQQAVYIVNRVLR